MTKSIYKQLSTLSNGYFDSASQFFLDDLIEYHLKIEPNELDKEGLGALYDWLEIAAHFLIRDQQSADSYLSAVRELTGDNSGLK